MFSSTRSLFDTVFSAMGTSRRSSSRRHRRTPIPCRLRFEQLEGRTMLSGVTTQAALIAAINTANATVGSHSITLCADITLYEATANNTNDGPNGLPSITSGDNLTILGKGHVIRRSTSSADAAFRLFDVASGASLNLDNLSLENGLVSGPAATTLQGGAIFVESGGKLNLDGVTLSGNSVNNAGVASQNTLEGGAIYNAGTATMVASTVTGNSAAFSLTNAAGQGDNDAVSSDNGNGLIGNVVVEGGGIYNAGSLSITSGSLVSHNSATSAVTNGSNSPSGGVGNGNSNGDGNAGTSDDNGNGISGNVTVAGGGIYNFNSLTANDVTVSANYASSSVANGSDNGANNGVDTASSSGDDNGNGVDGNIIVSGGGIANDANGTATIADSNVSGNWAASSISNGNNNGDGDGQNNALTVSDEGKNNGNGVVGFVNVSGGGLDNESGGTLKLANSVVSFNSARSSVINGNNNGNYDGNDDGDGDGLASNLTVHGGGIRNAGTLTVTQASLSATRPPAPLATATATATTSATATAGPTRAVPTAMA